MQKLIEAIPNFSTSDQKILQKIINSIKKVENIKILDFTSDIDHNRSVITFVGDPENIEIAAFETIKKASELIDMNKHLGIHPAIGACDVMPFVPLKNAKMSDCISIAKNLGQKVSENLEIPVYLYEFAAQREERKNLAYIRNRGFKKIKSEISKNTDLIPDFGPKKLGNAGAICIGARKILIAFNVNLKKNPPLNERGARGFVRPFTKGGLGGIQRIKDIAHEIREKNGGFKNVKALGLELKSQNLYQISMNLTDFEVTKPKEVFDKISTLAEKYGFQVIESELIGLIPRAALPKNPEKTLKLRAFDESKVLENAI